MPLIKNSKYNSQVPFIYKNAHFSTIYVGKFKKFHAPHYTRETINLSDGDFLK